MKAIVVPYAFPEECRWTDDFFPTGSIASLPICGKPLVAYVLDDLSRRGISEVLVWDRRYDNQLAVFLGDGSKWGLKVVYEKGEDFQGEVELRQRHSAFIGHEEVIFVLGNAIGGRKISSLRDYFDSNMALLQKPQDNVLPGYPVGSGIFFGTGTAIPGDTEINGPVCLGNRVKVGHDVVMDTVALGKDCVVDNDVKISRSVIFPHTYLGKHIEVAGKIVDGNRVIDPFTGACVNLAGDGIVEALNVFDKTTASFPAPSETLHAHSYTATGDSDTEALLADTLCDMAQDIATLRLPCLAGVFLGGGYGRGEGGVPLYNDLDFFVLVQSSSTEVEREEIRVALEKLGGVYEKKLGIHVDFCRPKTRADFKKDERRIMIQEFIRGNVPIYGDCEMLSFLTEYPAEALPASESLRTLVNRGMGLYLARESQDSDFVNRNINKAVLGAGDALLVAQGRYRWSCRDREAELKSAEYSKAVEFKFRPVGAPRVSWEEARQCWLSAAEQIMALRGRELGNRTLRSALRYVCRRHRLGAFSQLGKDPLVRIFAALQKALVENTSLAPEVIKDWETFN